MRISDWSSDVCSSDLLDEPTNHLDLDAVIWLQDWLISYPGTLLVISHDREFLDAVTTHTLHLENLAAVLYTGNYSQFERQRAERLTLQAVHYDKQQRERSEEHTSELQSLMRISYAVFCLKKKTHRKNKIKAEYMNMTHTT